MQKIFVLFTILFISLGLIGLPVEAKRFGGGVRIGKQRSLPHYAAQKNPDKTTKSTTSSNRWLGPLAGFAAGSLLASLFMGHGIGGNLLGFLLIGGFIFLLWRLFKRLKVPAKPMQYAQAHPYTASGGTHYHYGSQSSLNSSEKDAFIRHAKTLFIRLQAAYDSANLADIREFTTPEVFAEIQLQLQERGNQTNYTEVVSLNAEPLQDESSDGLLSILFSGYLREAPGATPEAFEEVWHFQKLTNTGWLVAGIQQTG